MIRTEYLFLLVFVLFLSIKLQAQSGCTDPLALNYDPQATINDGSCTYEPTNYNLLEITQLPAELNEGSGLQWTNEGLWLHNDGGNPSELHLIDTTSGAIIHTVLINGFQNLDWEDIAEDDNHIYLGDFGNNAGNRTDLRVLRLNKTELLDTLITVEEITFEYEDQTDFSEQWNNNNFDCEAFIYHNDSLHFFTKNWNNNQTKHYQVPAIPGHHSAVLTETFDVEGLITGADISEEGEVVLLGYDLSSASNFLWLLFDFQESNYFSGNKRRIELGTFITNSQTEGITFRENGFGYICSEEFKVNDLITFPQKLFSFSIRQWIDNSVSGVEDLDELKLEVFPNPFHSSFQIKTSHPIDAWRLLNSRGELIQGATPTTGSFYATPIQTELLVPGIYFIEVEVEGHWKAIPIVKK